MADFNDIPGNTAIAAGKVLRRNAGDSAFEAFTPVESGVAASLPSLTLTAFPSSDDQAVTRKWNISREHSLLTNGNGGLGTNHNFSEFTFKTDDVPGGGGSFYSSGVNYYLQQVDELLPLDPSSYYECRFRMKMQDTPYFQSLLYCYDIDGLGIGWREGHHLTGTETTLANDLAVGDTTIVLTSAANWYQGGDSYQRGIRIDKYKNAGGYLYPPYTYTRYYSPIDSWSTSGISGNTITLNAAWPNSLRNPDRVDGKWLAGTPVSNVLDANEAIVKNHSVSAYDTWEAKDFLIKKCPSSGIPGSQELMPGSAFGQMKFYAYGNSTGWYKLNNVQFYRLRADPVTAIADVSGNGNVDSTINSILAALRLHGIVIPP